MCGFCNVWLCVFVGFVVLFCVFPWVLWFIVVCMCGFCNVWILLYVGCVSVVFLMCRLCMCVF